MNPSKAKEKLIAPGNLIPFILITSLFVLWGLANNMTDTLPAAIYIKRFSYKSGVLLGLGLYLIGCYLFFPAKLTGNYFHFLGAQIGVWSFTIRYAMASLNLENIALPGDKTPEQAAATYYIASLILFASSRFIFTFMMKFFRPSSLLAFASVMAIISSLIVIFGSGMVGVIALVSISGFMSLMFPTIFGQAVIGLGDDTKIGGSGLIMAILGGAVVTFIQGRVSDSTGSINFSYIVPLACFILIAYYSYVSRKIERKVINGIESIII